MKINVYNYLNIKVGNLILDKNGIKFFNMNKKLKLDIENILKKGLSCYQYSETKNKTIIEFVTIAYKLKDISFDALEAELYKKEYVLKGVK
jgi:hypothetical protein